MTPENRANAWGLSVAALVGIFAAAISESAFWAFMGTSIGYGAGMIYYWVTEDWDRP